VFPPGEIEFKRDTGPNWKSLCQPAILPLTIDFHPSPQELNNPEKFHFQFYDLLLSATDHSYYTSHSELLMEMVRQRLVQDFQIVPQSIIKESKRRGEIERLGEFHYMHIFVEVFIYLTTILTMCIICIFIYLI
jgi:hypothetical protein